ncbi:VC0807 family protein [Streptomyces cavernae]|uniref:VC0807 family protein n=1 Tax=Streptomyces cavernae TaxID=2259034 RepID=UPI00192E32C5|nr:VC0807 family protein [Streptomyces cavernae]
MTPPTSPGSAYGTPTPPPAGNEAEAPARPRPSGGSWGFVITVACDIVLPVGLYYLLRGLGADEITSLLVSGSAPALHTLYLAVRHRRLDAIGVFTLTLLVVSALASLMTASPRVVLARNSLFTALAGVWLLVTLFTARPFTYQALKALMPGRSERLESLWSEDLAFRRIWRVLTVVWGIGLFADALLRLVMAYTLPIDTVPALDAVLYAATWIVLQIVTQISLYRSGTFRKIFAR